VEVERMMEEVAAEHAENCVDTSIDVSGLPTEPTRPSAPRTPISSYPPLSNITPVPSQRDVETLIEPDDISTLNPAAETNTTQTPVRGEIPYSSIDDIQHTSDDDDDDEESLEFIYDLKKRSQRFRTCKTRMIRQLHHIGAKTSCYGILYLRKYLPYLYRLHGRGNDS
jgi:hypothetical protein